MTRTTASPERLTISVEDAAAMLGISRALAYVLVRRGDIPSLRLGRRVVIPEHAFRCFVEGQKLDVE